MYKKIIERALSMKAPGPANTKVTKDTKKSTSKPKAKAAKKPKPRTARK
jgi:hypothetical protein